MFGKPDRYVGALACATASALLVAVVMPAGASPKDGARVEPTSVEAPASPAAKPDKRRYCVVETITGSRIPLKTCRTAAEWAAEGVDITPK